MATFQERINQFRQGLDTQQNHFNDAMGMASDYGRQVLEDKLGQHYENIEKVGGTVMSAGLALGSAKNSFKAVSAKYRAMKSGKPQSKAPTEQKPIQMTEPQFEPAEREGEKQAPAPELQAEQQSSKDPLAEVKNATEDRALKGGEGYRIDYASLDDPAPQPKGKGRAKDADEPPQEEDVAEQAPVNPSRAGARPSPEQIQAGLDRGETSVAVGGVGGGNYRYDTQKQTIVDDDAPGEAYRPDRADVGVGSSQSADFLKLSDEADMRSFAAPGAGATARQALQDSQTITRTGRAVGEAPQVSSSLPPVEELSRTGGQSITTGSSGLRTGGTTVLGDTDTGQRIGNIISNGGSGNAVKAPPTGTGTAEQMSANTSQLASQVEQRAGEGLAAGRSLVGSLAEGGGAIAAQALGGSKNVAERDVGAVAGGGLATKSIASAGKKLGQKAGLVGEDAPSAVSEPTTQLGQLADRGGQAIIDATGALKSGVSNTIKSGLGSLGLEDSAVSGIMAVGGVAAEAVPVLGDLVGAGMLIYGLVKDFKHAKSYTPQTSAPTLEATEQAGGIDTQALGGSKNTGGGIV